MCSEWSKFVSRVFVQLYKRGKTDYLNIIKTHFLVVLAFAVSNLCSLIPKYKYHSGNKKIGVMIIISVTYICDLLVIAAHRSVTNNM